MTIEGYAIPETSLAGLERLCRAERSFTCRWLVGQVQRHGDLSGDPDLTHRAQRVADRLIRAAKELRLVGHGASAVWSWREVDHATA